MAVKLRENQQLWLDTRLRFRNAAKDIMFLRALYPKGNVDDENLKKGAYSSFQDHADAAYTLLRQTVALWEVEDPLSMAGTLPVDLQVEDAKNDIPTLTFALERNEAMIKVLHKALDVLLRYIAHEREELQRCHREQLSRSK